MKRTRLYGAVCSCFTIVASLNAEAVIIGSGDVYQQSTSVSLESIDITLLPGGTIAQRSDSNRTYFLSSNYDISGGTINADITLDIATTLQISDGVFNNSVFIDRLVAASSNVSGGTFNDSLTIDRIQSGASMTISGGSYGGNVSIFRLSDGGILDITGGIFTNAFDVSLSQGDLTVSGGNFSSILTGTVSTSGGVTPTTTFIGSNWMLNSVPLVFVGNELVLTGQTGTLSGKLSDGNEFSAIINGFGPAELTVVNAVPLPAAVWLFGSGLLGLIGMARRKKSA